MVLTLLQHPPKIKPTVLNAAVATPFDMMSKTRSKLKVSNQFQSFPSYSLRAEQS